MGYMASGKSSIGNALAEELGCDFVDLDQEISKETEMDIPQIFSEKGEIFFRKKESEVLKALMTGDMNFVLATGGGTPCYGANMQTILDNGEISVYLKLSIPSLVERLLNEKESRPLVQNIGDSDLPEFVGKHLFERRHFYMKATHVIECDGKSIEEIVSEIRTVYSRCTE